MTVSYASGNLIDGRFEVESILGSGGFATVYKALDRQFDRIVAVKVLHLEVLGDDSAGLARFRQEAQIIGNLRHRNILTCYSTGLANGLPYSAIEYVDALTLHQEIEQRAMTWADFLAIARGTALGLHFAHQHGIIHRDLTPKNIMVDRSGNGCVPRIIDFGLARITEGTRAQRLTQDGIALGTAYYSSPEQAMGQEIDARADIYSLGCVLYHAATGVPPFLGDDAVAVFAKHVTHSPNPPVSLNPAVPKLLNDAIMRCLEKDPKDRFQSAEELHAELESVPGSARLIAQDDIRRPLETKKLTTSSLSRKQLVRASLFVLLFAAAAAGYMFFAAKAPRPDSIRALATDSINAVDPNQSKDLAQRALRALAKECSDPQRNAADLRCQLAVLEALLTQPHLDDACITDCTTVSANCPIIAAPVMIAIERCDYYMRYQHDVAKDHLTWRAVLNRQRLQSRDIDTQKEQLDRILAGLPITSVDRVMPLFAAHYLDLLRGDEPLAERDWWEAVRICQASGDPRGKRLLQTLYFDSEKPQAYKLAIGIRCSQMENRPAIDRVALLKQINREPPWNWDSKKEILVAAFDEERQGTDADSVRVEMACLSATANHGGPQYWTFLKAVCPRQQDRLKLDRQLIERARIEMGNIDRSPAAYVRAGEAVTAILTSDQLTADPALLIEANVIASKVAISVRNEKEGARFANYARDVLKRNPQIDCAFTESMQRQLAKLPH